VALGAKKRQQKAKRTNHPKLPKIRYALTAECHLEIALCAAALCCTCGEALC